MIFLTEPIKDPFPCVKLPFSISGRCRHPTFDRIIEKIEISQFKKNAILKSFESGKKPHFQKFCKISIFSNYEFQFSKYFKLEIF